MLNLFSGDPLESTELVLLQAHDTCDHDISVEFATWQCARLPAGSVAHPDELHARHDAWLSSPHVAASYNVAAPCTVAALLTAAGRFDLARPAELDADDWWFRTSFTAPACSVSQPAQLVLPGLAGLAEFWLNGRRLAATDNAFRSYRYDVAELLRSENELVLVFRSLDEELKRRRPRPRWKTNLVRNQQLRWHRQSLVGRIPGWAPCAPAIGPWRGVKLEAAPLVVTESHLTAELDGLTGVVRFHARFAAASIPERASLRVGEAEIDLKLERAGSEWSCAGELRIPGVERWWPHTHGTPTLHACELTVVTSVAEQLEQPQHVSLGSIGFRTLEVRNDPGFGLKINGEHIYCRGGCWTTSDLLSPGDDTNLRRDLELARDAGANMIRVGGTMQYESDAFYRLCDELGLLVWQDFMFANMDYPVDDAGFRANIRSEAIEQLQRLARHPCVAVYCGNSEIEQQAAMLGLGRELWSNDWFGRELEVLCTEHHPGTTYLPSTPTGGVLPFHTHTGVTHYYGVGAYLRPTTDVRLADVKFTSECLGFANMPEPETMFAVTGGHSPVMHDPAWKQRVPRDGGAGWDFEDVRDHYLRETFMVDPQQLRSFDLPRYIALSRAVTGEMMARAFAEWRSTRSHNAGGLIWFYKDLWPGAGWGVVDSLGLPKAAYYYLKRSWQPRQLTLTDEGLNGIELHLTNETDAACEATVELALLKEPNIVVVRAKTGVRLDPRSRRRVSGDELLGRFCDTAYAYRFGPPQHDVVVATWRDADGNVISEAYHFVRRLQAGRASSSAVHAHATKLDDATYQITVAADRFLDTVRLAATGYLPDDNYFHLPAERTKVVTMRAIGKPAPFRPTLEALNLDSDLSVPLLPRGEGF